MSRRNRWLPVASGLCAAALIATACLEATAPANAQAQTGSRQADQSDQASHRRRDAAAHQPPARPKQYELTQHEADAETQRASNKAGAASLLAIFAALVALLGLGRRHARHNGEGSVGQDLAASLSSASGTMMALTGLDLAAASSGLPNVWDGTIALIAHVTAASTLALALAAMAIRAKRQSLGRVTPYEAPFVHTPVIQRWTIAAAFATALLSGLSMLFPFLAANAVSEPSMAAIHILAALLLFAVFASRALPAFNRAKTTGWLSAVQAVMKPLSAP